MQDEFDTLTATKTPTLSFGAAPEPELLAEKEETAPVQAEPMDDSILSDEEKNLRPRLTLAIPPAFYSMVRARSRRWQIFPKKLWNV